MIVPRSAGKRGWPLLALAIVAVALLAPGSASAANVTASVAVVDSHGNGIAGVPIHYWTSGSWFTFGTTDGTGVATATIPEGSYKLLANYNQGGAESPEVPMVPSSGGPSYTFHTVPVTLLNSPPLIYATNGNSGWHTYTGPMEMFPGSYLINNGHGNVTLTVGATGFTGGILRLVDHSGNGLAGGTASYYLGGWSGLPGTTDANGNLLFSIPNDSANLSIAMQYGGTQNQQTRAQLGSSNFTFQTALAVVKLEDADGNALDTGTASYYAGGWHSLGNTSGGQVSVELLPGSYSFAMDYNFSHQQLNGVAIAGPTTDVVFQTGRLTLSFSGTTSWYHGGWHVYSKPMEYLPGVETFYFGSSSDCSVAIPISSGDHLVKSAIVAKLVDSANHKLAGGVASAYASGWKPIGTTAANGQTCAVFDGTLGNTAVAMSFNGTRQQIVQNQPTNSIYAFATTGVTVELRNSGGSLSDTGNASYYAGGWHSIGSTSGGTTTVQMLPGHYSFAMTFNGTRQQQNGVAISGTTDTVTFQTTDVTVALHDSGGSLIDTGNASYYASGWHSIGSTSGGQVHVEMLPGSYAFAMTLLGTRQQQNGVGISGTTDTVAFQTGNVHSSSGTATSYYAGGWKPFTQDMELLPGKYWFDWGSAPQAQVTITAGATNNIP